MVPWPHGPMVTWSHGPMVPWSHGPMVGGQWSNDQGSMVSGQMINDGWFHGPMVPWSHGLVVPWSGVEWPWVTNGGWAHGPMVPWSSQVSMIGNQWPMVVGQGRWVNQWTNEPCQWLIAKLIEWLNMVGGPTVLWSHGPMVKGQCWVKCQWLANGSFGR